MIFETLKPHIETIVQNTENSVDARLLQLCEFLKTNVAHHNWVGFYFRNGTKEELILGSYSGAPQSIQSSPLAKAFADKWH